MTGKARATPPRDQDASPFAAILGDLVPRIPGALAAALVDCDGETVDYAGRGSPFDVRVAAAHWRLVLDELIAAAPQLGRARSIVVRGTRRSFLAWALPDAYAIVLLLSRRAGFAASPRALHACERALCREAGWPIAADLAAWQPVAVECDRRKRPMTVATCVSPTRSARGRTPDPKGEAPEPTSFRVVQVLGTLAKMPAREKGFRIRLESGAEVTLVREPGGYWYADEAVDSA
jgi:hypothetical protein